MAKKKNITVDSEIRRLRNILKPLPAAKLAVAEGIIKQAARNQVIMNDMFAEYQAKGLEALNVPKYYKVARLLESNLKTLAEMAPVEAEQSKLLELMME